MWKKDVEGNDKNKSRSKTKGEIAKVRVNIKRRATETQVILGGELGGISEVAAINFPVLHHIRRNIQLQRQANQQPPNPVDTEDVPELNDPASMSSSLYYTVDNMMLIAFSSLEQTKKPLNSVLFCILIQYVKDAFTISYQIYGRIFKTLVYRTFIKTMKTLRCGFVCFPHYLSYSQMMLYVILSY